MSTTPEPLPPAPRRPSAAGTFLRFLAGVVFTVSLSLNILVFLAIGTLFWWGPGLGTESTLRERYHSGKKDARDKIAVVHVEGVILEGMTSYARKQIEAAAVDEHVKAVVVRINSPGGSISASDDLYRRLGLLRDGDPEKKTTGKPLVASMASLAASGGYYIAMPAKHLVAERTTITGSIGVYASFPNVSELAQKWGVKMDVIKRGDVKTSGSMFHEMTPQERQLWQDMIDHAYAQFLAVVRQGRGDRLKYPLEAEIVEEKRMIPARDAAGKPEQVEYVRRLADGGIFTADKAQKYGLIDQIGYLDDAIAEAAKQAGLGQNYQVVGYDRPRSLWSLLLEVEAPETPLDLGKLADGALPRIWYLTPESGLSGFLAAASPVITPK